MMSYKMGTKYKCEACESEFVVIKPSPEASLKCCDQEVKEI